MVFTRNYVTTMARGNIENFHSLADLFLSFREWTSLAEKHCRKPYSRQSANNHKIWSSCVATWFSCNASPGGGSNSTEMSYTRTRGVLWGFRDGSRNGTKNQMQSGQLTVHGRFLRPAPITSTNGGFSRSSPCFDDSLVLLPFAYYPECGLGM